MSKETNNYNQMTTHYLKQEYICNTLTPRKALAKRKITIYIIYSCKITWRLFSYLPQNLMVEVYISWIKIILSCLQVVVVYNVYNKTTIFSAKLS